jgi:hypothetical protein
MLKVDTERAPKPQSDTEKRVESAREGSERGKERTASQIAITSFLRAVDDLMLDIPIDGIPLLPSP